MSGSAPRASRIAIVGTGFGVRTQLPGFRLAGGFEVVSLTGARADRTRTLAREHGVPYALDRFEDALTAGAPDLVSIATPPSTHLEYARDALAAGRHVLLEKPMAMHAGESEALAARAAASNRLALVDHELRAIPNRREAKRRIGAGDIGLPLTARVTFTSHGRARPDARHDWWARRADGGGLLGAIGSHVVDMLRFWLGPIVDVDARLFTSIETLPDAGGSMRPVETDDVVDLRLGFASGARGTASLSAVAGRYEGIRWEVSGTEGALVVEPDGRLFAEDRRGAREDVSVPDDLGADPVLDGTLWARGFVLSAKEIRRALTSGQPPALATSFADALVTQRVLDAARDSSSRLRPVPVDG